MATPQQALKLPGVGPFIVRKLYTYFHSIAPSPPSPVAQDASGGSASGCGASHPHTPEAITQAQRRAAPRVYAPLFGRGALRWVGAVSIVCVSCIAVVLVWGGGGGGGRLLAVLTIKLCCWQGRGCSCCHPGAMCLGVTTKTSASCEKTLKSTITTFLTAFGWVMCAALERWSTATLVLSKLLGAGWD